MEGITILNTIITHNEILTAFIAMGIIGIIIGIFIYLKDDDNDRVFGSAVAIASLVISIVFSVLFFNSGSKKQYEVTIDENVKFNEFMEHYKVIEQHGQIYVIEEREGEEL